MRPAIKARLGRIHDHRPGYPHVRIKLVARVLGCDPEAVRRAAVISGIPIVGDVLGVYAPALGLDFLELCQLEHAALDAAKTRRGT